MNGELHNTSSDATWDNILRYWSSVPVMAERDDARYTTGIDPIDVSGWTGVGVSGTTGTSGLTGHTSSQNTGGIWQEVRGGYRYVYNPGVFSMKDLMTPEQVKSEEEKEKALQEEKGVVMEAIEGWEQEKKKLLMVGIEGSLVDEIEGYIQVLQNSIK